MINDSEVDGIKQHEEYVLQDFSSLRQQVYFHMLIFFDSIDQYLHHSDHLLHK